MPGPTPSAYVQGQHSPGVGVRGYWNRFRVPDYHGPLGPTVTVPGGEVWFDLTVQYTYAADPSATASIDSLALVDPDGNQLFFGYTNLNPSAGSLSNRNWSMTGQAAWGVASLDAHMPLPRFPLFGGDQVQLRDFQPLPFNEWINLMVIVFVVPDGDDGVYNGRIDPPRKQVVFTPTPLRVSR